MRQRFVERLRERAVQPPQKPSARSVREVRQGPPGVRKIAAPALFVDPSPALPRASPGEHYDNESRVSASRFVARNAFGFRLFRTLPGFWVSDRWRNGLRGARLPRRLGMLSNRRRRHYAESADRPPMGITGNSFASVSLDPPLVPLVHRRPPFRPVETLCVAERFTIGRGTFAAPGGPSYLKSKIILHVIISTLIFTLLRNSNMQQFDRDLLAFAPRRGRLLRTRFDQRARARGNDARPMGHSGPGECKTGTFPERTRRDSRSRAISVGRLIDRLEARGLVERRADPADRRNSQTSPPAGAEPFLEEISKARDILGEELLYGVELSVRTQMVDALLKMKSNLTAEPAPLAVGE